MIHTQSTRTRLSFLPLEDRCNPSPSGVSPPGDPAVFGSGLGYSFTNWPDQPLNDIRLTTENTFPVVGPRGQGIRAEEDWIVRDPFPITDLDGKLVKIGGWYMVAGLATPRNDAVGTLREFRYLISPDGVNWQEGGRLITADDAGPIGLGDQLFSGDFRYDAANNRLLIYYTPVQGSNAAEYVPSASGPNMRQEIAVATATPVPTANTLTFTNYVDHGIKLRPDGNWYATPEGANTETEVYAFRDPYLYRDPETGVNYLLFAANWGRDQTVGYPPGAVTGDQQFPDAGPHDVVAGRPRNDGVVGVAVATDDTLLNWRLLPPVFGAVGVNEQLELPHIVFENGLHYLLLSTHNRTFIGDLKYDYPEGFYGFVADDFQGPWRPVNGTSLIFSNPPQDELQNYAWKAADLDGGRATVLSFINKGNSGTVSPAVTIRFDGDRVVIDDYQTPTGAGLPQPTVLAFGVTPTAPIGTYTVPSTSPVVGTKLTYLVTGGTLTVSNADGSVRFAVAVFPGFGGDVRTAAADVNGDGTADVVAGAGFGGGPHVKVYDGLTGGLLADFFAFDPGFFGGVWVGGGDLDGDGRAEVVVGAGEGGGPHVKAFAVSGGGVRTTASFFAYDPSFRGGVRVAVGPLGGPARIWTGAGERGAPHVRSFDPSGRGEASFFAGDPMSTGGAALGGVFTSSGQTRVVIGGTDVRTYTTTGQLLSQFSPSGMMGPLAVSVAYGDTGTPLFRVAGFGGDGGAVVRLYDVDGTLTA
jgi:hypothetical protein